MVTSLFWRSAIVGLSQSLTPASSSLRGVFFGFKGAMVNRAQGTEGIWGIQCLLRSDWSLRWLDVCICTDASEKGFAFAVREGCRELASEVGRVSERTSCKRSARSIRARSRAFRSMVPESCLECSSSDEDVISLARRECRADFLRLSLQL